MHKEPLVEKYNEQYTINAHQVRKPTYSLHFDVHKNQHLDITKPTYIFDIDHTLLNSNELKESFNDAFASYDQVFALSVWQDTYESAKTKENYYDFNLHITELAKKIDGTKKAKEELTALMQRTLIDVIPNIIHPNLFWQMNDEKEHINLVLATAGDEEYHRMKVRALLAYLPLMPVAIIYVEKTDKGETVNELYKYFKLPDEYEAYVFDDNPAELEQVHEKCKGKNLHLIRVRQPNGHYNSRVVSQLIRHEEWNY